MRFGFPPLAQQAIWGRLIDLDKPRQRTATEWAVRGTVREAL